MAQNHNPESEKIQHVLSQDSPESKTPPPQKKVKDSVIDRLFTGINSSIFGTLFSAIVAGFSFLGFVNMKWTLILWSIIVVIIIFMLAVKEWRSYGDSHRLLVVILLSTVVSVGVVWTLYALMLKLKPVELHFAYLVPANEASPSNNCPNITPDTIAVYIGNSVHYTTKNDLRIISADKNPLVTAKKTTGGLLIDLKLFDSEGKKLATIVENEFVGEVSDNLNIKNSEHSVDIFDKNNKSHIFHIRYLNRNAVEVFGVFNYPGKKSPLRIEENKGKINGQELNDNCYEEGLGVSF